jgi:glycosyltransferase involved in cell wall biosynthesis
MRALPAVLEKLPEVQVLVIGAEGPHGYGAAAPQGTTWKSQLLQEVGNRLDLARVHFLGRVSYPDLLAAFSVSRAHVYYTYPFVLSWSLLEAMACECLIIGSDTAPVRDVIAHGTNGLLLDFFDTEALACALIEACRDPERYSGLRKAAREAVVTQFDQGSKCLPAWLRLIDDVLASGCSDKTHG